MQLKQIDMITAEPSEAGLQRRNHGGADLTGCHFRHLDLGCNEIVAGHRLQRTPEARFRYPFAILCGGIEVVDAQIDRAMATSNRLLGPNHPMTGSMLMTLGLQLFERDQLDAAERLFQQALPISEKSAITRGQAACRWRKRSSEPTRSSDSRKP